MNAFVAVRRGGGNFVVPARLKQRWFRAGGRLVRTATEAQVAAYLSLCPRAHRPESLARVDAVVRDQEAAPAEEHLPPPKAGAEPPFVESAPAPKKKRRSRKGS